MSKRQHLVSLNEAAAKGIERVRKPEWADRCDHLKINAVEGRPGLWLELWCPFNTRCNGRDPVKTMCTEFNLNAREWLPHSGPTSDSDEYRTSKAHFDKLMPAA